MAFMRMVFGFGRRAGLPVDRLRAPAVAFIAARHLVHAQPERAHHRAGQHGNEKGGQTGGDQPAPIQRNASHNQDGGEHEQGAAAAEVIAGRVQNIRVSGLPEVSVDGTLVIPVPFLLVHLARGCRGVGSELR